MEFKRGHVESASPVTEIEPHLSECLIQIDFDEYYIFYDVAALMSFVNKDVIYKTRPDIVHGKRVEVVCEIALVTEVVTVDKAKTDVKLIPFDTKRPVCNFNIKDVRFGEFKVGCVAILTKITAGQSKKANWFDCEMIDAYGHIFELRMFTTKNDVESMENYNAMLNGYVSFDMESTKYGYQTSEIIALFQDVEQSPEIAIAKNVVMNYINSDLPLAKLVSETSLDTALDRYVDTEPGYLWVRIASELYVIDTLDNITSGVNIQTMKRAAVCTRLYSMPHNKPWSNSIVNVMKILRYKEIIEDQELCSILDIFYNEESGSTKDLYLQVRKIVDNIIAQRRGLSDEEKDFSVNERVNNCRNYFNGLL